MSSGAVSASTAQQEYQPRPVWVRHVQQRFGAAAQPNETLLLGKPYYPSVYEAVNGRRGYHKGTLNPKLNDEGEFEITFPNVAGEDGVLHRNRFQAIQKGKRIPQPGGTVLTMTGGNYRAGDEWLEVYEGEPPGGDLLFVATPTKYTITMESITLQGYDALFTAKKQRETAAGYWVHAPRDVFEYYCGGWQTSLAEDFNPGPAIANATDSYVPTADGRLTARQANTVAGASTLRLGPVTAAHPAGTVLSLATVPAGQAQAAPTRHQAWRAEARVVVGALGDTVYAGVYDSGAGDGCYMQVNGAAGTVDLHSAGYTNTAAQLPALTAGTHTFAVEGRGRWVYYYVDGQLAGVRPMPTAAYNFAAYVQLGYVNSATSTVDVDYVLLRQTKPYLLTGSDPGDYRLPGAPTPGGLLGEYYSDVDLNSLGAASYPSLVGNPVRLPTYRRIDLTPTIDTTLLPAGAGSPYFSVRWTGSIYLDLDVNDRFVRQGWAVGKYSRIYIGKTRIGEEYTNAVAAGTTGASLRSIFGNVAGWYPIVIEVADDTAAAAGSLLWATTVGGSYTPVPPNNLSALGIYQRQVRFESHFDQLQQLQQTFGLQFACAPKRLESGQFPGVVVPRVRVGRDTEKVLTVSDGTGLQVAVTAEETADDFLGDGQGLADPKGATQITAEVYNFAEIEQHLLTNAEYDSIPDVPFAPLLQQRVTSLLALRGSSWEQASGSVRGYRELLDAFPLTGVLAEFAWGVGDGARLYIPELAVEDASPRQIMGLQLPFVPDGKQATAVQFRARPRNLEGFIRDMRRGQLNSDRYYQRQLATVSGTAGGTSGGAVDPYSRVPLPSDITKVAKLSAVVFAKSDASAWGLAVNGVVVFNVTSTGRYDVTQWLAPVSSTQPWAYCNLSAIGGSTGTYGVFLEALVVV